MLVIACCWSCYLLLSCLVLSVAVQIKFRKLICNQKIVSSETLWLKCVYSDLSTSCTTFTFEKAGSFKSNFPVQQPSAAWIHNGTMLKLVHKLKNPRLLCFPGRWVFGVPDIASIFCTTAKTRNGEWQVTYFLSLLGHGGQHIKTLCDWYGSANERWLNMWNHEIISYLSSLKQPSKQQQ